LRAELQTGKRQDVLVRGAARACSSPAPGHVAHGAPGTIQVQQEQALIDGREIASG
jgi:hypothetical protein